MSGTVVFAGDSITEWGRQGDPDGLGTGYVRMLADGPLAGSTVRNAGVGGDTLADLAARWPVDVLAHRPEVVSVYIGVNDTWRALDSGRPSPIDRFVADYERLVEPLVADVTRVLLVEPWVLPMEPGMRAWAADLDPRRAAVRELARSLGVGFVPLAAPMQALAARIGAAAVTADGVHPTPAGHRCIADAWSTAFLNPTVTRSAR